MRSLSLRLLTGIDFRAQGKLIMDLVYDFLNYFRGRGGLVFHISIFVSKVSIVKYFPIPHFNKACIIDCNN